ncbi:hypothetical protein [Marinigracilibium pacificum]|uniref:Uncharacterized protein n=1 Tax=Marinigracilibium pacificum TaxID=2729599 RepID=A0A848JD16_9BACT|nr:hypothetical protein [Marinigracilibium pacificum]NMM50892.1 hypothetical protein [Marinigracilibium pacificum]
MKIVPGKQIEDYLIGDEFNSHPNYHLFTNISDNEYKLGHILIRTNKNGGIHLICTSKGNFQDINIGMTFYEIIQKGYELLYDEFDQLFYLNSQKGLCIEKKYENLRFEELLNSKIEYLTVFDTTSDYESWELISSDFDLINKKNINKHVRQNTSFENFVDDKINDFKNKY